MEAIINRATRIIAAAPEFHHCIPHGIDDLSWTHERLFLMAYQKIHNEALALIISKNPPGKRIRFATNIVRKPDNIIPARQPRIAEYHER
jgi:hypothetical protein